MRTTSSTAPQKTAILAIILVSYVMIILDTSVVLTGLPKNHQQLGFSDTGLGAAAGLVDVAHQLGNSLGLAVLVAVAAVGAGNLSGPALQLHRVDAALDSATALLALALVLVFTVMARPAVAPAAAQKTAANASRP